MLTALRECERAQFGRDPTPGATIVDSRSVRAGERGGLHGYDGGKKAGGIKRHLLVDTCGTALVVCVSPTGVGGRDDAVVLFSRAADASPRLRHVWAGQGYRGAGLRAWAREVTGITVEVVQRRDGGFRSTTEKRGTATGRAPLLGGRAVLGGGADIRLAGTVPPPVEGLRVPACLLGECRLPLHDHAPRASPRKISPLTGFPEVLQEAPRT